MSNFKGTKGPWLYSPSRHTHDSIIHTKDAKEEYGYISNQNGGVVGSSEWIWLKKEDAKLISCAPEMLEMLQEILRKLPLGACLEEREQIKILIKKATEI